MPVTTGTMDLVELNPEMTNLLYLNVHVKEIDIYSTFS